ncbi:MULTISPECIES: hypothetical protein [unclassified Fusobacterium]|uniref:hypothetical protein n=1 Tax=unclassified Fusobacterium TaxID=2648384 RepID=UPI001B8AA913|nr:MULTISPECIES: hypothetical protein [unclassified Fusobacterium]MBR8701041.1 hypothetical protein [Fusobacterium sp. DD45]MBR8710813.1 hypothetical protein [Fusobacterium sp. DD28]MBR8751409.1 hypothetical protein [Fusobacterium sp. DD26]
MKYLMYVGTKNYSLNTENDVERLNPLMFSSNHKIIYGTSNLVNDLKSSYSTLFNDAVKKYNTLYPKKQILNYYEKINKSRKVSLATGVLIRYGNKHDWNYIKKDYKKIAALYEKQFLVFKRELLDKFYITNAIVYFENIPCLRIIGIPFKINNNPNKLEKQVYKSDCFNLKSFSLLREILKADIEITFKNLNFIIDDEFYNNFDEDMYIQKTLF